MEILTQTETLSRLCRLSGKFGMYINIYTTAGHPVESVSELADVTSAAPYLNFELHGQLILDGVGYLLFDTEEELLLNYDLTVGDDGPTNTNTYSGSVRVYALTCAPDGTFHNENT